MPFKHPPNLLGTPLHWACLGNSLSAVRLLVNQPGINLDAKVEYYNATALDIAQKNRFLAVVRFLKQEISNRKISK